MNNYLRLLTVCLFFPLFLGAQKLDSMLNIYANNYPQEKIYLQLDKKLYKAGETVWFKAYIFTGADPSLLSRNFYAELSDPSGMILERKVYPVTEFEHGGQFRSAEGDQEQAFTFKSLYDLDDQFRYRLLLRKGYPHL